jgi:hypothetical protein
MLRSTFKFSSLILAFTTYSQAAEVLSANTQELPLLSAIGVGILAGGLISAMRTRENK